LKGFFALIAIFVSIWIFIFIFKRYNA